MREGEEEITPQKARQINALFKALECRWSGGSSYDALEVLQKERERDDENE